MTLCRLEKIHSSDNTLYLRGLDLLDGTPILDIKPYLPYADIPQTPGPHFETPYTALSVKYSAQALMDQQELQCDSHVLDLVKQRIALDPRPYSQKQKKQQFHIRHSRWDFSFEVIGTEATVNRIQTWSAKTENR